MPIWRLIPIDLNHDNWKASTYQGQVIVRAISEERAREIAADAFLIATQRVLGRNTPLAPWIQAHLVSVLEVKDTSYPDAGSEEIIGPEEALE